MRTSQSASRRRGRHPAAPNAYPNERFSAGHRSLRAGQTLGSGPRTLGLRADAAVSPSRRATAIGSCRHGSTDLPSGARFPLHSPWLVRNLRELQGRHALPAFSRRRGTKRCRPHTDATPRRAVAERLRSTESIVEGTRWGSAPPDQEGRSLKRTRLPATS